ncbi:MAG: hypothetical protein ACO24W_01930 [Candidatus Nanopelagicales bacterium]
MSSLVELRAKLSQAPSRLLLGITIMLVSAFLASNLISTNDSTAVKVFVTASNLAAGQKLEVSDLIEATLSKSVDSSQWFNEADLSPNMYLITSLKQGDVLRKSDITLESSNRTSVSLLIQRGRMPANVQIGDVVDIWDIVEPAVPVIKQARIVDIEILSGEIAVTVLVPNESVQELLEYQELTITVPA